MILRVKKILPLTSFIALIKSCGSLKLTNPKPLVLCVCLSLITLAFMKVGKWLNALASTSSVTSLPRSPQNILKSPAMVQQSMCS